MPNKNENLKPVDSKEKAIKSIENLANSPETGEKLVAQLKEAHQMLDEALKQVKSPDEELSLKLAKQDLESLETVLTKQGSKRKLNQKEKESLRSLVTDLNLKVAKLDVLFDLVDFDKKFSDLEKKYEALNADLYSNVSGEKMPADFRPKAEKTVAVYDESTKAYSQFYASVNAAFGVEVPPEIQAKVDETAERLSKMEAKNKTIKNDIAFADLEKEFLVYKNAKELDNKTPFVVLTNLARFAGKFAEIGSLTSKVEDMREKELQFIYWNAQKFGGAYFEQGKTKLKPHDLTDALKVLVSKKDSLKPADFDKNLSWIVSNVVFVSEENVGQLPVESDFYKSLYNLVQNRIKDVRDDDILANGTLILSQLGVLAAKTVRASVFKPGVGIWKFTPNEHQYHDYSREDKSGSTEEIGTGSEKSSDNYSSSFVDTIESVDVFGARLKLKNQKDWVSFTEFEKDEYHFGSSSKYGDKSVLAEVNESDLDYYNREAARYGETAEFLTLKFSIESTGREVPILKEHIPARSLLLKFLDKKWLTVDAKGAVTVAADCPKNYIKKIYKEVMKQFMVERIYVTEQNLAKVPLVEAKKDPFFESKKSYVKAQREIASGDIYSARVTLVEFLKKVNSVTVIKTDDMKAAEKFAITTLKGLSKRALVRLGNLAQQLFATNENYKLFYGKVAEMLQNEEKRLEESDRYSLNIASVKLSYGDLITDEAVAAGKKNVKPSDGGMQTPGGAHAYELGYNDYLTKHSPTESVLNLWNQVVNLDDPVNYAALTDSAARKQKFEQIGDSLRYAGGGGEYRRGADGKMSWVGNAVKPNPEAAVGFYREALGEDVADAEFELMETRDRLKNEAQKFDKSKYFKKAEDQIQQSMASEEMKSLFVGKDKLTDQQFDQVKTSLSDKKTLRMLAAKLLDEAVDEKLTTAVYDKFNKNGLRSVESQRVFDKIKDVEGLYDVWFSDRQAQFAGEITKTAIVMAISVAFGAVGAAATRVAFGDLVVGGAEMIEDAALAFRLTDRASRVLGMTLAQNRIEDMISGKGWGTLPRQLLTNVAMIGSVETGMFAWGQTFGKKFVGAAEGAKLLETRTDLPFVEGSLYREAGGLTRAGLRTLDWTGRLTTEGSIFTGLSVAEKLTLDGEKLQNINLSREFGMNLVTILAMRGGNMLFEPVYQPIVETADAKARIAAENGNHSRFLQNSGLSADYFDAAAKARGESGADAELKIMNEQRAFLARHGLEAKAFAGKTPSKVQEIMKRVNEITGEASGRLSQPPSAEVLTKLALGEPEVFEIIAGEMLELPLTEAQVAEIIKVRPELILKFVDKLSSGARDLLANSNLKPEVIKQSKAYKELLLNIEGMENTKAARGLKAFFETVAEKFPALFSQLALSLIPSLAYASDGSSKLEALWNVITSVPGLVAGALDLGITSFIVYTIVKVLRHPVDFGSNFLFKRLTTRLRDKRVRGSKSAKQEIESSIRGIRDARAATKVKPSADNSREEIFNLKGAMDNIMRKQDFLRNVDPLAVKYLTDIQKRMADFQKAYDDFRTEQTPENFAKLKKIVNELDIRLDQSPDTIGVLIHKELVGKSFIKAGGAIFFITILALLSQWKQFLREQGKNFGIVGGTGQPSAQTGDPGTPSKPSNPYSPGVTSTPATPAKPAPAEPAPAAPTVESSAPAPTPSAATAAPARQRRVDPNKLREKLNAQQK